MTPVLAVSDANGDLVEVVRGLLRRGILVCRRKP